MDYCYVDSKFGKIKGEKTEYGKVYHSIPYAVTKRFEDPKPVKAWEEFDATQKQVNCWQRFAYVDESIEDNNFYYREFDFTRDSDWAESPMTLTVRTPLKAKKCPVIVFVHGGSFENGCIDDVPFGSSFEYPKRGIIFVSLGYRLNVFGLYDSHNFGLRDLVFGINWVKDNIADFGGDPDHIVLMGQSAGAMCVSDLLLDSDLKGIVKAAIMMSGAGLLPRFVGPKSQEENHEFWVKVMEKAGCENEEELKKVDPQTLWQAWYDCKMDGAPMTVAEPAIDGQVIKDVPHEIVKRGEDLDVPLMIGVTSQDMFPYVIYDMGLRMALRNARRGRSPAYGYYFDRTLPGNCYKAFHASDLWYQFGSMEISWRPWEQWDYDLSKMIIDYTANFVKKFDPNGEGLPEWSTITRVRRRFRLFGNTDKQYIQPANARRKLMNSFLRDKGPF